MNHDPGPRRTQSASSIAASASGQGWGWAGRSRMLDTRPRVDATRCWPQTTDMSSGRSGSAPTTSASISNGSPAMGRTRPRESNSLATRSRPATVSPNWSQRATINRLPIACPPNGPSPPNRCWSTSRQICPHGRSSQRAASAIRRSPGGRTLNSSRSRPDDPPSSATVTTAVTRSVTRRSAANDAAKPCPPPNATTRGPFIRGRDRDARRRPPRAPGRSARPAPR